jgi:aerobic-type carbon monoxide dehydrogenase small subunit (CoxS/CutS family)
MNMDMELTVNGSGYQVSADPRRTLADFLRDDLRLTGTHLGCEHGVCGACTVMVDGKAVRSCLMLAVQADGCDVMTIEGLEKDGQLHPLQEALRDCHSFQCGFCTPGFVMTALAMIEEGSAPANEEELREELAGNLCRCTGYQSIVEGVTEAIRRMTDQGASTQGADEKRVS